jgi:translocation and assembly module TamB
VNAEAQRAAPRPPRGRAWKIALAIFALVALAIAALVGYGLSEHGLAFLVDRIVARSGGHITVEEPTGSIAGTMRFRRITWEGADATMIAEDVVVDWNPGTLLRKHLSIRGLGAQRIDLAIKPSSGGPSAPPTDLRLPLSIDVERLAVAQLDWRTGPRAGRISGLEFGYAANATSHRIRDLRLVSDFGRLQGDVEVGTRDPLPVKAHLRIDGDGPLAGANVDATLDGPIARIGVAVKGTYRDTALSVQATATPFGKTPFSSATALLSDVDAATFDASLPHTRANVHLAFSPQGDGIAGTLDVANADPGPIDADRVPLAHMASRFALTNDTLRLDAIDATLSDGGGARGDGTVVLAEGRRSIAFTLDVANLDLARIHTKLLATNLSGHVSADADPQRQRIEGDVRDRARAMTLAFAATIADERVDVSRFRASAAAGALAGSASLSLRDAQAFTLQATMQNLDPSRFAAVPKASLDGTIDARGALKPRWSANAQIVLAHTSSIEGVSASGQFAGVVAPGSVRDAKADVTLGSARVTASGAAGRAGDRLAITLDAPRLADVAVLVPAAVPRPLTGELHASGHLALAPDAVGGDVEWRGRALHVGPYAAETIDGRASIGAPPTPRATFDQRALAFEATATKLVFAARRIETFRTSATGSLARHHLTLALRGEGLDASLAVDGGVSNADRGNEASWRGTIASFENHGDVPVRLEGSAELTLRSDYVRLGQARLDVADGRADVGEFVWDAGRITTRGAFTGVPLASAARLAKQTLPVDSTLVLGGDWNVAAAPRLDGHFTVNREGGDLVADVLVDGQTRREQVGITALTIAGTFHDDALEARATFASARAGTANGSVSIGAVAGAAPGRIDTRAPLHGTLRAELPSLAVFQHWIGTEAAINGRAQLDVTAAGTVAEPLWTGVLTGSALAIDSPRYGVHVSDGRVRAHLVPNGVALDEARFKGGDGTFEASGLLALPSEGGASATRVTWKADQFRITNRPDMRFVVNGEGSIAIESKRLALRGNVGVVEGHVEYEPSPTGKLAPDIVIKGQEVAERRAERVSAPLALDVEVDLGNKLTFVGAGLDARLAGRVHVTTGPNGRLIGRGTIRAVNGTYYAFGQKLTIDRGRVIFDGPLDNPALDIVALRKNLQVEAGVELSGTVKVPQVRITSNPPVPENEALSWLVTGQGLGSGSGANYAALAAASGALLGKGGKPIGAQIAQRLGLDDISLKSGTTGASASGTSSNAGLTNQVVVFGKRISDRLTLGYEQGLSLATSALRLEYALSRRVTLRAEAGQVSGVGIVYRRSFR